MYLLTCCKGQHFESVTLESNGGLMVQQLLDSPGLIQNTVTISGTPSTATSNRPTCGQLTSSISNACTTISESIPLDDDDVFQCGRCKQKFSSLDHFMVHKRDHCAGKNSGLRVVQTTSAPQQPTVTASATSFESENSSLANQIQVQVQPHQSTVSAGYTRRELHSPDIIVSESELLPFTIEATQVLPLTGNLQTTNFLPVSSGTKVLSSAVSPLLTTTASISSPLDVVGSSLSPSQTLTTIVGGVEETNEGEEGDNGTITNHVEVTLEEKDDVACYNHEFFHGGMAKTATSKSDTVKTKPKHKCSFCGKEFSKNFDLQQHIRSHTGEKPFQCIVCGRAFTQKSNVKKHMTTHRVWPFGSLSDTLPKDPIKKLLLSPSVSSVDVVPQMDLLGNVVIKEEVLVDDSYVCQFCGYSLSSYVELRTHMKIHANQKVYRCIQKNCDLAFEDLDSYLDHIRTHDKDLQYRCHTCSKVFSSLNTLGYHQYEHSVYPQPKKPVGTSFSRCPKCMNKYASNEALEHHLRTSSHHYPCKLCGKVFMSERLLRRHLRVHGTVNLYTCSICTKEFKSEYSLKLHQLIHTGEKPFECQVCKTAFNRKDKLKRHMLTHETKKFKCPFKSTIGCMREFSRPDKLRVHMITHVGGRSRSRRKRGRGRTNNVGRRDQTIKPEARETEENKCSVCNLPHSGDDHKCLVVESKDAQLTAVEETGESSILATHVSRARPIRQAVARRAKDQTRYGSRGAGRKKRGGVSNQIPPPPPPVPPTSQPQEEEEQAKVDNQNLESQDAIPQEEETIIPVHSVEGVNEIGNKGNTKNVEIIYIPFSLPLTRPIQAELIRAMSSEEECHVTSEILEGGPTITLDGTTSSLLVGNNSVVPLVSPTSVHAVDTIQTDPLQKESQELQAIYSPSAQQISAGSSAHIVETSLTGTHIQTMQLDHEDGMEESQLAHTHISHLTTCILPDQT
ncbi:zinc finger protein 341-like isoform X2 [Macrobrachium nipponense]|uniref:zinc finger protein 341-like isoform X2 n=1 Tax=Macrobrachium nipponense TaxID=159736 RepID=UPI0030C895CB